MMKFKEQTFIPVLLGGDINTYSMARAFYEEYQVKSYVFGKYPTGPSCSSRIIEYRANPKIDTDSQFLWTVNAFAKRNSDKTIILIGCGDSYVALISRLQENLQPNVLAPTVDFEHLRSLQNKENFYQLCRGYGIAYPDTYIYHPEMGMDFELPFPFPVILKPSNGIEYWEHAFDKQDKVYTISDRQELEKVIGDIYQAGYTDSLVIQDMVPGNDEYMRVLTSYSDQHGKVKMMCLGHVLLEEHTPHGKGNHAVIITEQNEALMRQAKRFLEDIHYIGFSNFDIKYDTRDGKYKFFEINTRQGRSNYYVTGSGFNMAKYIVEEYIYGRELEFETAKEEHLWLVVPRPVAFHYVRDKENREKMKELFKEKRKVNPIFFRGDLKPKRFFAMAKNYLSHFIKFSKYYKCTDNGDDCLYEQRIYAHSSSGDI